MTSIAAAPLDLGATWPTALAATGNDRAAVQAAVRHAQLRLVLGNARIGLKASAAFIPLFGFALFRLDWPAAFWAWLSVAALVTGSSLAFPPRALRRLQQGGPTSWLEKGLLVMAVSSAGVWGSAAALFYRGDPERLVVLMLTLAIALYSISSAHAADLRTSRICHVVLVLPFVVVAAFDGALLGPVAAFTMTGLLALSLAYSRKAHEMIVGSIRMRFENQRLSEALTEQRVRERTRVVEEASRHKSEFLASMSHELRTPLNAIIGYSELLQEEAADAGALALAHDLHRIDIAGHHLLELIDSVLDLSKIEAGRMELHAEEFAVADLLAQVEAVIAPLAARNGNALALHCSSAAGGMYTDRTKLRQVLLNLLGNACKFTAQGRVELTASREVRAGQAWLAFHVTDTGIGIESEQLGRLFNDFVQADVHTSRRHGGTGLGLALSRRLCRLLGGDVTAASRAGQGSRFTAELPARLPVHAAPAQVHNDVQTR